MKLSNAEPGQYLDGRPPPSLTLGAKPARVGSNERVDKILPAHPGATEAPPRHPGGQQYMEDKILPTHPHHNTWVPGHGWVARLTQAASREPC